MSVMNTHDPVVPSDSKDPTLAEELQEIVPRLFVVPVAGPPVILLLGPLLILVLLLIPPAAFLITLVLVLAVGAGLLVALGAVIASPFLLVRHLRARQPAWRHRLASLHRRPDSQHIPITPAKGTT